MQTPTTASFVEGMKSVVSHVETVEALLKREKYRNVQLETVIKIMARRNDGKLLWTRRELDAAVEDERCIMLGALDMNLYGETTCSDCPPEEKTCDCCEKPRTKTMNGKTSSCYANWFVGYYCDDCFAELERIMKQTAKEESAKAAIDPNASVMARPDGGPNT